MKRMLLIVTLSAGALAAAPAAAQTPRDAGDLETLTVLEVDPTANEIRVRERGSTRIRTIELDEASTLSGARGTMGVRDLRPGDTIRVPGVAGSVSDRVRADQIQVLGAPREPAAPEAGVGQGPGARSRRAPSTLQPDPDAPSAVGAAPGTEPGRVGADPGASGDATRGTGSQTGPGSRSGTRTGSGTTGTMGGTGGTGGTGGGTGGTGGAGGAGGP